MPVGDIKDNMKNFKHPINSKMLNKKYIGLLLNGAGDLATADVDKAEVPNAFFASVFTSQVSLSSVFSERVQGGDLAGAGENKTGIT